MVSMCDSFNICVLPPIPEEGLLPMLPEDQLLLRSSPCVEMTPSSYTILPDEAAEDYSDFGEFVLEPHCDIMFDDFPDMVVCDSAQQHLLASTMQMLVDADEEDDDGDEPFNYYDYGDIRMTEVACL